MTAHRAPALARCGTAAALCVLAGCSNGDFGRVNPGLVNDDIHSWIGTTAALGNGAPISSYPLTDDERALRDLAYPLIEPPYDRQRWYSFLNEYGIGRVFRHDWSRFDQQAYARTLMRAPVRSQEARYARLNDDILNDRTRTPQFFGVAARVLEMDRKREAGLAATRQASAWEQRNATARISENLLVVSWVQWSLLARSVAYRYALERLVLAGPTPMAVQVEHSLLALHDTIAGYRLLPGPDFAPGPGVATVPPFDGLVPIAPPAPRQPLPPAASS
jgi:hypothetical protein